MVELGCTNPLDPGEETITATDLTIRTLARLLESLPIGTNLARLQFMWLLVSGHLLQSRGALYPKSFSHRFPPRVLLDKSKLA